MKEIKSNVIDAALNELGQQTIENCKIPTKEDLMSCSKEYPLSWDPIEKFTQNEGQPDESFRE